MTPFPGAAILAACILLSATEGAADIYSYVNDEGVTCFTDTPATRGAVIIMKDRPYRSGRSSRTIPPHLAATGIAKKVGTHTTASSGTGNGMLPVSGRITSIYGLRHDPIDGRIRLHNGVDIAVPSGTPVRPAASGTVVFSGTRNGYGNMVIVEHGDGVITLYAHNSLNLVSEGTPVDAGTVIALSGSTGRSTGPHLHFEAWKDGVNTTSAYFAGSAESTLVAVSTATRDTIRRIVEADGSITFTNMR